MVLEWDITKDSAIVGGGEVTTVQEEDTNWLMTGKLGMVEGGSDSQQVFIEHYPGDVQFSLVATAIPLTLFCVNVCNA